MKPSNHKTVILANGDFPREGGVAWKILANAGRVVACDGAADAYIAHFGKPPSITVGDMDSLKNPSAFSSGGALLRRISGQDDNDLAKAVRICRENGWENPVILGATGKRDDHTLGNIFRAFEFGLEIVTDYGRFTPVCGEAKFALPVGSPFSVFAPDPATHATSRGLEWPLDGVKFTNLYCATLNRTNAPLVEIASDRTIFAYIPFPADATNRTR